MRLHPLEIPGGWMVAKNHFYNINPDEVRKGDRLGFPFIEDILQLSNDSLRMTLDLGWYPDGDPNGSFRLSLIQWDAPPRHNAMPKTSITSKRNGIEYTYKLQPIFLGDAWSRPLMEFSSRDATEVVRRINETLNQIAAGHIGSN